MNIQLLREVQRAILMEPATYNQQTYNCGTAGCMAWHAVVLREGKAPPLSESISDRAQEYLGLTNNQRAVLFSGLFEEYTPKINRIDRALWGTRSAAGTPEYAKVGAELIDWFITNYATKKEKAADPGRLPIQEVK